MVPRETKEGRASLHIPPLGRGRSRGQTQVHLTSEPVSFADPTHYPLGIRIRHAVCTTSQPRLGLGDWEAGEDGLGTFLSLSGPCPPRASSVRERPSSRPHEEFPSCLSSGPAVICSACSANFPVSRHGIWYSFAWINVQPLSSSGESYSSPKFRPARLNNSTKMLG